MNTDPYQVDDLQMFPVFCEQLVVLVSLGHCTECHTPTTWAANGNSNNASQPGVPCGSERHSSWSWLHTACPRQAQQRALCSHNHSQLAKALRQKPSRGEPGFALWIWAHTLGLQQQPFLFPTFFTGASLLHTLTGSVMSVRATTHPAATV